MTESRTPYPLFMSGHVIHGHGRGSKELGIPTANLPQDVVDGCGDVLAVGIYYGWATVPALSLDVYPMVMSMGWNPYYNNDKKSAEVHIIHPFDQDFYGEQLMVLVCGWLREERNYNGVDALIADIRLDIHRANALLLQPACQQWRCADWTRLPQ